MHQITMHKLADKSKQGFFALLNLLERLYIPLFLLLTLLIAYLCFYKLGVPPVISHDEARHGINAYEMLKTRSWIVNTFHYQADYWNLKPPISYWCIILSFQLFGFTVFALRFYSAFSYLLLSVVAGLFVKRYGKLASLFFLGFMAANFLAFRTHMARAGDADSLYTLLFSFAMLSMFLIRKNQEMLYVSGLMFALAFLTKSWHAGMIMVIGGLFLLLTGELKRMKLKQWGLFLLSFTLPVLLWAAARFRTDRTAFFREMIKQDLLNRTGSGIEGHAYPMNWYYENVFMKDYIYLPVIILCFMGLLFFNRVWVKEKMAEPLGYLLWFALPFAAFSITSTKLIWYVYPTFIPLFIVASVFLDKMLHAEQVLVKFKVMLLVFSTLLIVHYARGTFSYVHDTLVNSQDELQTVIADSTAETSTYDGQEAYIDIAVTADNAIAERTDWANNSSIQNVLFMAEISGDFDCKDGGISSFLATKNPAILIVSSVYYEANAKALSGCNIIFESDHYKVLAK